MTGGVEFLRAVRLGEPADLTDRQVVVVGGGNVAIDAARTARRLGARSVRIAYRRGREEMPAHDAEVVDAEHEGVGLDFLVAPLEVLGDDRGNVYGLRCTRMALGAADASGRRRPEPDPGSEHVLDCQAVIVAIGMAADTSAFTTSVAANGNGTFIRRPGHAPDWCAAYLRGR